MPERQEGKESDNLLYRISRGCLASSMALLLRGGGRKHHALSDVRYRFLRLLCQRLKGGKPDFVFRLFNGRGFFEDFLAYSLN